ncbi:hypothetical protein [Candidatus Aquicultor secundus]|nr:hypothetical protein [Candidatus Aquicultor secundus]NCO66172.1 hypothetical protein [Solirubrobacter sp.]
MNCKNHPNRETNVSCSNCGEGLCPECMVYTPVGIKCRECAAPNRGMLRQGKPSQYIGAALAGLAASVIGGFVLSMGFRGSLFVSLIFGLLVGEAVRRGARGNRGPAFMAIAAVTTLIGLLAAGYGFNPMGFVFALIIAGIAAYRLSE